MARLAMAALLAAMAAPPAAEDLSDIRHWQAVDGDSLRGYGKRAWRVVEVRIQGIDAPELHQHCPGMDGPDGRDDCGVLARDFLGRTLARHRVRCRHLLHDRYRRSVARCQAGGRDLGAIMVRAGLAWEYKRFSDGRYTKDEAAARKARTMLWSADCAMRPGPWKGGRRCPGEPARR